MTAGSNPNTLLASPPPHPPPVPGRTVVPRRRSSMLPVLAVWGTVLGTVGIVAFVNPAETSWLPRCAFHSLTGLNCPGCGATRALHHLAHGHILAALRCNALLLFALPYLLYSLVHFTLDALGARTLPPPRLSARSIRLLVAVAIAFAVLRNIPVAPFVYLSP